MKHLLPLIFFSCVSFSVFSQDLIVTQENDSINCKITKVKTDNIYFIFKHKEEVRSTLLPLSNVVLYKYSFYEKSEVSKEKVNTLQKNYKRFKIAINGGFSYRTAKILESVSGELKDYIRELKSGYHLGADITFFVSETLGVGLKYSVFRTSNSSNEFYLEDFEGNSFPYEVSDDITVAFIGPSFSTRYLNSKNNNAFYSNMSLGYMSYKNQAIAVNAVEITSNTLGLAFDIGYDIELSKNFSLGFQISYLLGTLREYRVNDGFTTETVDLESDEFESLNRLDFSIGLRFSR